jgi:hypothetical protein
MHEDSPGVRMGDGGGEERMEDGVGEWGGWGGDRGE